MMFKFEEIPVRLKRRAAAMRQIIDRARVTLKNKPITEPYKQRLRPRLSDWLLMHQNEVLFKKCSWMGIPALKNPMDAWVYQEILYAVKPDVVIEIGSYNGGGTLFLANMLDIIGKGMVVSVDIDRSRYIANHDRIITLTGDSSSPEIVASAAKLCSGKTVLVIQDGGHSKTQVLKDLEAYAKLVSVNSYFIVEDGITDLFKPCDGIGTWEEGPLPAIAEFLKGNQDYVLDQEKERYVLTSNPSGFLKRIK